MTDWQPIETAPKDGTEIILTAQNSEGTWKVDVGCFSAGILWDWGWRFRPTHWMPLPPPPKKENE